MTDDDLDCFVTATLTALDGFVRAPARVASKTMNEHVAARFDVSGVIGVSGALTGAVVISCAEDVARRAIGRIVGIGEMPALDQDVADGVGEIVNVVVGNAKRGLEDRGVRGVTSSLPTVILGGQHAVFRQRNVHCLLASFESEIGSFLLQVCLRSSAGSNASDVV